jgi:hypothetical protein
MPLANVPQKPGFLDEATDREVGKLLLWKSGDHVRFFNGKPQKIGGWVKSSQTQFVGKARATLDWVTTRQENFTAVGTHKKLYVFQGGVFYDITPIRDSGNLTNPFTTSVGLATVKVADVGHGCNVGDYVHFSGAAAVGGITITGEYAVTSVTNVDEYYITHSSNAGSTAGPGGGTVAYEYEINIGNEYDTAGLGWGAGDWDEEEWGDARTSGGVILPSRIWSLAVWGEDLLANPYNGAIYVWQSSGGVATRATVISQAPSTNKGIYVAADERQIVALGAHDGVNSDPLLVRWCSMEDYTSWTVALSNTAGDKRLEYGNEIYCALLARGETVIHTDTHLYSMTLVGLPEIYGFRPQGANGGLVGPHAVIAHNGILYWMAAGGFYKYDGTINELPCPVFTYVYGNINKATGRHIYAAVNLDYGEIWWLYASAASAELDSYVLFNITDNSWAYGTLARTAMVADSKYSGGPYAFGGDGYMYAHETGVDADGSALAASLESGDFEVDDSGNEFMHIGKFVPDMLAISGTLNVTFTGKKYPHATEVQTSGPHAITSSVEFVNPRIRCRQIALSFASSNVGDNWRLGLLRIDAIPDGGR